MNITVLLLITFSCTWSLASPLYLRPDAAILQEIDGTIYEFGPDVPRSGDWLALYPYQRYPSTRHRSKRQTDWGVSASLTIPLGGGSSRPSWGLGGFVTRSDPSFSFTGKGQIGGQFGNTPDWSFGGVISRSEGDWTGRLGGGLNSQGGSTIGVGLERGGLGGHIDATNGKVSVGRGSVPNTDPSKGYASDYR